MPQLLTKENIEELRSFRVHDFMDHFLMFNLLARSHCLPENSPTEFWVDQWRDFKVILSKTKLPQRTIEDEDKPTYYVLLDLNYHRKTRSRQSSPGHSFAASPRGNPCCSQHEDVQRSCGEILDHPGIIDWNTNLIFDYLSSDLWVLLESRLESQRRIPIDRSQPQYLYSTSRRNLRCPPLPFGTRAVSQHANNESHRAFIRPFLSAKEGLASSDQQWSIVEECLGKRSPPYCSAAVGSLLGDVTILPVPWRERTYETHAVAMVAEDILDIGSTPVMPVGVDDRYTQDMVETLGFSRACHPKSSIPIQVRKYRVLNPPVPLIDWPAVRTPRKKTKSRSNFPYRVRKQRGVGE